MNRLAVSLVDTAAEIGYKHDRLEGDAVEVGPEEFRHFETCMNDPRGPTKALLQGRTLLRSLRRCAPLVALLAGCTPQQIATGTQYTEQIAAVCAQANAVLPMFPQLMPWLSACQTATGIARLALDPDSLTWLTGILGRL